MQQCLFSWKAVVKPRKVGTVPCSACTAGPVLVREEAKMDLIDPSMCWFQRTIISFGVCEAQHIWCLVPCWPWKSWSYSASGCFFLCSLMLTYILHQGRRGLQHGGWNLDPKLEYLFLWKLDFSCNLYKIALFKKKFWNWFGLITESFIVW